VKRLEEEQAGKLAPAEGESLNQSIQPEGRRGEDGRGGVPRALGAIPRKRRA